MKQFIKKSLADYRILNEKLFYNINLIYKKLN
jgi:hypothetical protein